MTWRNASIQREKNEVETVNELRSPQFMCDCFFRFGSTKTKIKLLTDVKRFDLNESQMKCANTSVDNGTWFSPEDFSLSSRVACVRAFNLKCAHQHVACENVSYWNRIKFVWFMSGTRGKKENKNQQRNASVLPTHLVCRFAVFSPTKMPTFNQEFPHTFNHNHIKVRSL